MAYFIVKSSKTDTDGLVSDIIHRNIHRNHNIGERFSRHSRGSVRSYLWSISQRDGWR